MRSCSGWRRFLLCFSLLLIIFHIFSVFEFHPNSVIEAAPKKRNKKSDHLVLGPAAGQGLPNRLQCQGSKALNKSHFLNPSNASNVGDSISFVTVFTIYSTSLDSHADDKSSNLVTVGNVSYTKKERSMAILNVFINFIQLLQNSISKLLPSLSHTSSCQL